MSPSPPPSTIDALRAQWIHLYSERLPELACSKDPIQPSWPVHVDHCFGRIVLDAVVGEGKVPWMQNLKGPAVKNMNEEQLRSCVELGEKIAEGKVDLVQLDEQSLRARGKEKGGGRRAGGGTAGQKRKAELDFKDEEDASSRQTTKKQKSSRNSNTPRASTSKPPQPKQTTLRPPTPPRSPAPIPPRIHTKITTSSTLTPFRKRVLLALCQVPSGHYTTYAAIATHLNSSARAVGNALRNNPFAPEVPCHRVVASDGGIGGFGGDWGPQGKHVDEKWKLLREEGVKVREKEGRVEGGMWANFRPEAGGEGKVEDD